MANRTTEGQGVLASTAGTPFLFTATFSMITGFVGRPNYLTWSQVSALDHSGLPRPHPRLLSTRRLV